MRIERQAEIKPFGPDTDNAETGNRVPHHTSVDFMTRDCETSGRETGYVPCPEVPHPEVKKVLLIIIFV